MFTIIPFVSESRFVTIGGRSDRRDDKWFSVLARPSTVRKRWQRRQRLRDPLPSVRRSSIVIRHTSSVGVGCAFLETLGPQKHRSGRFFSFSPLCAAWTVERSVSSGEAQIAFQKCISLLDSLRHQPRCRNSREQWKLLPALPYRPMSEFSDVGLSVR